MDGVYMPKKSGRGDFSTVSLPRNLIEEIDRIVELRLYGYDSRAEFIKDAIRRRLDELKKSPLK
jgi:metal-responsive CopG/Arc/MetJ family transcriptional regulator